MAILTKEQQHHIRRNKNIGMIKEVTAIINTKHNEQYAPQTISYHLYKKANKKDKINIPDCIFEEVVKYMLKRDNWIF